MALSVVVLPAPLEPSKATICPRVTRNDTSAMPMRSPYRTSRCSTVSSAIFASLAPPLPPPAGGGEMGGGRPPMSAAEIGFDHRRFAHHRVGRAAGNDMTLVENQNMAGQGHDHFHNVFDNNDGN